MLARRRGQKTRWRVVVFLESLKALCRLLMVRLTNSRPLVNPPLPERETDPRIALEHQAAANVDSGPWDELSDGTPPFNNADGTARRADVNWTMPRTGLSLPTLPATSDVTEYLLKKVLTADDIKAPKQLLHRLTTSKAQVAELMWVLRPVVYAVLMQRWAMSAKVEGKGRNRVAAWTPWVVGVGIEVGARQLAKRDFKERLAGGLRGLTTLERDELRSRGWAMGWWALRGAFYENFTR